MAKKPSERRHQDEHSDEPLDLDVTPFLNIMFMLILSILAMTAWTQLAMLNVQAPQIGGGGGDGGGGDPSEALSQLNLTVFVLPDGFNVGASGATLDGNSEGRSGQPLIVKTLKKTNQIVNDALGCAGIDQRTKDSLRLPTGADEPRRKAALAALSSACPSYADEFTYDYAKLQQKLIEIKKSFPTEESMIVSADGNAPYEVIVKIMDAARRTPDEVDPATHERKPGKILFPAVAFAAGVVG
jgi:biopolymer transport protein ExbD